MAQARSQRSPSEDSRGADRGVSFASEPSSSAVKMRPKEASGTGTLKALRHSVFNISKDDIKDKMHNAKSKLGDVMKIQALRLEIPSPFCFFQASLFESQTIPVSCLTC